MHAYMYTSIKAHAFPLRKIPQKENFVKCDWPTQIFRRFEVENFQLLTMIFLENFLECMEMGLDLEIALRV